MESLELAGSLSEALVELKAEEPVILDLTGISDLFDAFVIVSGGTETHRRALADAVWHKYRDLASGVTGHREGADEGGWILLDCAGVVVHIMSPELRDYYELEEFWGDAPRIKVSDEGREDER